MIAFVITRSPQAKGRRQQEEITNNQWRGSHLLSRTQSSLQTTTDNAEISRIRQLAKSYPIYNSSSEINTVNTTNSSLIISEPSILATMYKNSKANSLNNDQIFEMKNIRVASNASNDIKSYSFLNRSQSKKIYPQPTVSPMNNFNDTFSTNNNSWIGYTRSEIFSAPSNQTFNYTQSPSDFDGLINKYKLQEESRTKLFQTNI